MLIVQDDVLKAMTSKEWWSCQDVIEKIYDRKFTALAPEYYSIMQIMNRMHKKRDLIKRLDGRRVFYKLVE